uniref:Uncharacterized protein n=1 Tax=Caenorhabditis tropicalis TaxID=1561998 RepID=A0A1I7SYM0_9PELO
MLIRQIYLGIEILGHRIPKSLHVTFEMKHDVILQPPLKRLMAPIALSIRFDILGEPKQLSDPFLYRIPCVLIYSFITTHDAIANYLHD